MKYLTVLLTGLLVRVASLQLTIGTADFSVLDTSLYFYMESVLQNIVPFSERITNMEVVNSINECLVYIYGGVFVSDM